MTMRRRPPRKPPAAPDLWTRLAASGQRGTDAEETFRAVVGAAPNAIFIFQKGRIVWANAAAEALTGYTAAEISSLDKIGLTSPEYRRHVSAFINREARAGEASPDTEFSLTRKAGDLRWVRATASETVIDGAPARIVTATDVTAYKRAEELIRDGEERYRALIEHSPLGILFADEKGNIQVVNRAMVGILDSPSAAATMQINLLTFPPLVESGAAAAFGACLDTDRAQTLEVPYRSKWGKEIYARLIATPMHDAGGAVNGLQVMIEDITEARDAAEALRDSERRLADLIDFLPDAMFAIDRAGRVTAWNRAVEALTGVRAAEMVGRGNFEVGLPFYGVRRPVLAHFVLDPADASLGERFPSHAWEGDTLVTEVYVPFPGYKKEGAWLWGRAAPLYDAHGSVTGAVEVVRDVTERKRAEEALRESHRFAEELLQSLPDGISVIGPDGARLMANRALCDMTGYDRDELVGERAPFVVWPPEHADGIRNAFAKMQAGLLRSVELTFMRKDGTRFPVLVSPSYLRDAHGAITASITSIMDISERRRAEEALRQSEERYRALAESSQDFIFIVDRRGILEYANLRAAGEFGQAPEALVGRPVAELFPSDGGRMGQSLRGVIERGEPAYVENFTRFPTRALWLDTWIIPLRDAAGAVRSVLGVSRDFTRRKEAEDRLRSTTTELQAVFEAIPDLYFRLGEDGMILDSKAGRSEELFVPPDQFLGKRMQGVLPPEVGRQFEREIGRLRETGAPVAYEYALPMPQGIEHYECRLAPLREGEVIAFVRNITGKKRAEEALIAKERYQALFERSLDCVFIHDFDGRFLDANNAMLSTLGYTARELLATDFTALLDEAQAAAARDAFSEISRTGSQRNFIEYRLRRKDGSVVHLESKGSVVYRDGLPWAIQGLARNITKRKRAEQQLQESERLYRELYEKYRNIIESTPDAVTIVDLEGTIVECNHSALEMHGVASRDELLGKSALDLLAPRDRARGAEGMRRVLSEGALRNVEYTLVRKGGGEFPAEMSVSLVHDAAGRPVSFVGIIKDITERKRLEQQAIQSEKMAAVGTLVAGLSHELNNPIGVILGYSQSLLKRAPADSPMRGALQSVEREAQRCATLVRVLLDFSHKGPTAREETSLPALACRAVENAAPRAEAHGVALVLDPFDDHAPAVRVNVTDIESAIINLLTNAFDATPAGGTVTVAVRAGARDGIDGVELRVTDTGSGIPPEALGKIFEPFFTTKAVGKGTGLGLSITRQIAESHGGRVEVGTAAGTGTTMTIWLPAAPSKE